MKKEENTVPVSTILIIVVVGIACFFGGMKYQSTKQPTFNRQAFGGPQGGPSGMRGAMGGRAGANRPVSGEVISTDEKTVTVKMSDGSSKIVLISASTQINKASEATKTDITTGMKVAVFGTTNSDGSVTAQNIQLNPTMNIRGESGTPSQK
jgi:Domain of unknown function (DUF5666)